MIELIPLKLLDEAQETERKLRAALAAAHEYIVTLRQMSYAGNHEVILKAWERSDAVGSRYYAARSAAGIGEE